MSGNALKYSYLCFFIFVSLDILNAVGRIIFECWFGALYYHAETLTWGASINGLSRNLEVFERRNLIVDLRFVCVEIKLSLKLLKSKKKRH